MSTDRHASDRKSPGGPRHRHAAARQARRWRPWPFRVIALAAIAVAVALAVPACLAPRKLATGQPASNFSLPELTSSSNRIALGDYAGKPLIINFFASWSPPCKAETQLLAHFYRFYHGQVQIIGVDSRDNRGAALRLMRRSVVTYPVANDPELKVAARYRAPGIPATYFLNAQHHIVRAYLGWLSWKRLRTGVREMNAG
jgi:thiol-disulfide isomerase/thioredoxin